MKDSMLRYYKTIGVMHSQISKADTMQEALQSALRIIVGECSVQYAVAWFLDEGKLHPQYWLAPVDLTTKVCTPGEGDVGQCFARQESVRRLSYHTGLDAATDNYFQGLPIGASICVPLSSQNSRLGAIQLLSDQAIDEETGDICEMLSLMVAMEIEDNPNLQKPWIASTPIMQVRNVHKYFQNGSVTSHVLRGVNLDIYEGEFLVLLGESGCGKSTLLNILGGMDVASEGSVLFRDRELSQSTEAELTEFRRSHIGFIFQSYHLMSNLNAKQNLNLIGELVPEPLDAEKVLELVGLGGKGKSYPSQLSGGQQQRISIARALIKKPTILFADEPTAALDYETGIEVLSVLEKVVRKGTTMVMVTHNEEITKMADRVVRMRNGKMFEVTVNRHPLHARELVW